MLLLIHEPRDEGDPPPRERRRRPRVPWRPFAWVAAFFWLLFAAGAVGGLAGYLILLLAIAVACWRADRWLEGQDWGGMRNYTRGY